MNNLDEYFARARSLPRAIPAETIERILDAGAAVPGEELPGATEPSTHRGRIMMMTAVTIVTAIAGIGIFKFIGAPVEQRQSYTAAPAAIGAARPGTPAAPPENTVTTATERKEQSPAIRERELSPRTATAHPDGGSAPALKPSDINPNPTPPPVDISGVKMIELTVEELALLGARPDSAGVWVFVKDHAAPVSASQFSMYGSTFPVNPPNPKSLGITPLPAMPMLITDDQGMWRSMTMVEETVDSALSARIKEVPADSTDKRYKLMMEMLRKEEAQVERELNMLMPIIVRTGHSYTEEDSLAGHWRPDCILWIKPTPELLGNLPEPIRTKIETELIEAHRLNDSSLHIAAAPSVTGEQPYLDILRTASGAIQSSSIFPNPATDRNTLRFRLAQPRTISVTLHDIRGEKIRQLVAEKSMEKGDGSLDIDLGHLPAGVYLLSITSDKGERAVQRLVVGQR